MTVEQIKTLIINALDGQGNQIDSADKLSNIMKEVNDLTSGVTLYTLTAGTTSYDDDGYATTTITTSQTTINAIIADLDAGKNVYVYVKVDSVDTSGEKNEQYAIIFDSFKKVNGYWYSHVETNDLNGAWAGSELALLTTANIITLRV